MEITLFRQAEKIKEGQLFIARKDSVEGKGKATLTPVDNCFLICHENGLPNTIFGTEELAREYVERYPHLNLHYNSYLINQEIL